MSVMYSQAKVKVKIGNITLRLENMIYYSMVIISLFLSKYWKNGKYEPKKVNIYPLFLW